MTYRFHHVHLICKDLEGMINFFTEALGATLVARRNSGRPTVPRSIFRGPLSI